MTLVPTSVLSVPMLSLGLVVLASVLHATWNLLAKRAAHVGPVFVFAYNVVACIVYSPWAAYEMMQGGVHWSWTVLLCLVASGIIHLAYSLALQRGYQVAPFSVVYPVARGTGPLLSSLGAFLVLHETPTLTGLSGLAGVVIGILMIATQGRLDAFRTANGLSGMRWGLTTGAIIASYTVVDAYGVKALAIAPVVLDWFGMVTRFFILAPLVISAPKAAATAMRGVWPLAIAIGILSPLAYILVLAALGFGAPLSIVAPMREMSMMIGALMGLFLLKEDVGPVRLAGCALLIAGVVLLSMA